MWIERIQRLTALGKLTLGMTAASVLFWRAHTYVDPAVSTDVTVPMMCGLGAVLILLTSLALASTDAELNNKEQAELS